MHVRLDQGLNEAYSCPTCRKPLFVGRHENEVNLRGADTSADEQLARQLSLGLDRNNAGQALPTGVFPGPAQNLVEGGAWRFGSLQYSSVVSFNTVIYIIALLWSTNITFT